MTKRNLYERKYGHAYVKEKVRERKSIPFTNYKTASDEKMHIVHCDACAYSRYMNK